MLIYSKVNSSKLLLSLIVLLIYSPLILTLKPCQNIRIKNYQYNLEQLNSQQKIILTPEGAITISFCKLTDGMQNSTSNNGYVLVKSNSNQFVPYTSNLTGTLTQYYSMIDQNNPELGIRMRYVPKYIPGQQKNQTIFPPNATQYNITTRIQTQNYAIINISCPSVQTKIQACIKTSQPQKTIQINSTYILKQNKNIIQCRVLFYQGCPTVVVNGFWEFLKSNAIVFAIVLWICALFLLILGYLAIRVTILLYGIYAGSLLSLVFLAQNYQDFYLQTNGIFIFSICLAVVLGILYGITLLTVPKIGYMNIGIIVAAVFSLLLQNSVLFLTGSLLAFYITFGVIALAMAIVALLQLKNFIVICTSFTGAFFFIRPLGFFLPGYPNQLINGNKFLSGVKTPWEFYLYLVSILILTGIGIALQICINKKVGKSKGSSGHYYLQDEGPIRDKLKKIFEFKQIKQMLKNGKKQILQLKNMITDQKNVQFSEQFGQNQQEDHGNYIQMQKMQKLQAKKQKQQQQQKQKRKNKKVYQDSQQQKEKVNFVTPKSKQKKQIKKRQTQQIQSEDIGDLLDSARDSDKPKNKKR